MSAGRRASGSLCRLGGGLGDGKTGHFPLRASASATVIVAPAIASTAVSASAAAAASATSRPTGRRGAPITRRSGDAGQGATLRTDDVQGSVAGGKLVVASGSGVGERRVG